MAQRWQFPLAHSSADRRSRSVQGVLCPVRVLPPDRDGSAKLPPGVGKESVSVPVLWRYSIMERGLPEAAFLDLQFPPIRICLHCSPVFVRLFGKVDAVGTLRWLWRGWLIPRRRMGNWRQQGRHPAWPHLVPLPWMHQSHSLLPPLVAERPFRAGTG